MIKMLAGIFFLLFALVLITFIAPRLVTFIYSYPRIVQPENVPHKRVAIVFGAGLLRDGSPTAVLRDRVRTASRLYEEGRVEKLLMSGDNSSIYYNEPESMRQYALSLGVPDEAIVLDYAGRRTYDTCYRAQKVFGLEEVILVTQKFHLPRAIYTCNQLGLPAIGVPADQREYRQRSLMFWNLRETAATLVALWEIHYSKPEPILGDPEPIFPLEAQ